MVSWNPTKGGRSDEFYALSTDTKPTDDHVDNGSILTEIDTGKKFMYSRSEKVWYPMPSGGGSGGGGSDDGGGSGGSGSAMIVNVEEDGVVWTCDKTWAEIREAYAAGCTILLNLPSETPNYSTVINVSNPYTGGYKIYYYNIGMSYVASLETSDEDGYPTASFD